MKLPALLFLGVIALAGAASAQPPPDNTPRTRTICLDPAGKNLPAKCRIGQASRLETREDICICPAGADRVEAPICPAGVRAPAESRAFERARKAAVKDGSLVGATFEGQPICVAPRNALNP